MEKDLISEFFYQVSMGYSPDTVWKRLVQAASGAHFKLPPNVRIIVEKEPQISSRQGENPGQLLAWKVW